MSSIDTLRKALEDIPCVRLAVLFGSAARGGLRPDSDIDVGVTLDGEADPLSRIGVELERASRRAVDLVRLDEAPPLLRIEVARDGRVLVERRPGDWVDYRARAMIDWWDWAPTARMMHRIIAARLREEAAGGST